MTTIDAEVLFHTETWGIHSHAIGLKNGMNVTTPQDVYDWAVERFADKKVELDESPWQSYNAHGQRSVYITPHGKLSRVKSFFQQFIFNMGEGMVIQLGKKYEQRSVILLTTNRNYMDDNQLYDHATSLTTYLNSNLETSDAP